MILRAEESQLGTAKPSLGDAFCVFNISYESALDPNHSQELADLSEATREWRVIVLNEKNEMVNLITTGKNGLRTMGGRSYFPGELANMMKCWPSSEGYSYQLFEMDEIFSTFVHLSLKGRSIGVVNLRYFDRNTGPREPKQFRAKDIVETKEFLKQIREKIRGKVLDEYRAGDVLNPPAVFVECYSRLKTKEERELALEGYRLIRGVGSSPQWDWDGYDIFEKLKEPHVLAVMDRYALTNFMLRAYALGAIKRIGQPGDIKLARQLLTSVKQVRMSDKVMDIDLSMEQERWEGYRTMLLEAVHHVTGETLSAEDFSKQEAWNQLTRRMEAWITARSKVVSTQPTTAPATLPEDTELLLLLCRMRSKS